MADNGSELQAIIRGDRSAFEVFVRKYQRLVSHIVFRMIANPLDREDLCQEIFLTVYRSLREFRGECKISSWVGQVAHNKCLNYLEKKKLPLYEDLSQENETIDDVADDLHIPDLEIVRSDVGARVRLEIDQLPPLYGTILALYHLEDMSYREIGEIMRLPDGTVKSYLFRARKMLRDRLVAAYQPEELWQ